MQVAGERLTTRTGLANQQHRGAVRGQLLQVGAQLLNDAALAGRNLDLGGRQARGLALALARLQRPLHRAQQFGNRQRLFDEIEGAEASRLNRRLDRAMSRHHDDLDTICGGHATIRAAA